MRIFKRNGGWCLFLTALLLSFAAGAEMSPVWTFTPQTGTSVTVYANGSSTIQYRIQNQSTHSKNLTLTMTPIPGVTPSHDCTLAPMGQANDSCTLTFSINGAELEGSFSDGVQLCEQDADAPLTQLQCYQPALADQMVVTKGEAVASSFIEISGTGTNVGLNSDDAAVAVTVSPHPINLFGTDYSQLYMSTNGVLSSLLSTRFGNSCLPSSVLGSDFGDALFVYFDDIVVRSDEGGAAYYQYFDSCPLASAYVTGEGCHVFEWYNVERFGGSPKFSIEAVIYNQSHVVVGQYGPNNPNGASATVGSQNSVATNYNQVTCNTEGSIPDDSGFVLYQP